MTRKTTNFNLLKNLQKELFVSGVSALALLFIILLTLSAFWINSVIERTREQYKHELKNIKIALNNTIESTESHVRRMKVIFETENITTKNIPTKGNAPFENNDAVSFSLFQKDDFSADTSKTFLNTITMMERVFSTHKTDSTYQWSYFYDVDHAYTTLYPKLKIAEVFKATNTQNINKMLQAIFEAGGTQPIITASPQKNPSQQPIWTIPYKDAGGAGMTVSIISPVFKNKKYAGVVGTDITLDKIRSVISNRELDLLKISIINTKGNIILNVNDKKKSTNVLIGKEKLLVSGWILKGELNKNEFIKAIAITIAVPFILFSIAITTLITLTYLFIRRFIFPALFLAEQTVLEQSELQAVLMQISNEFINVPLAETENAIYKALETLGNFTNTDRAYIFNYDIDKQICSNTFEWCAEDILPQKSKLQNIHFDKINEWKTIHFKGETIHYPDVEKLPENSFVKKILVRQGVLSILAMPMMNGTKCIGFVGFDAVNSKHEFTERERKLLNLFTLMLVNVFNRNKIQKELESARALAETASVAKSEFLANMSHEIRTPLNAVIGFTELLKETPLNDIQKQYIENANVSGHTLLAIINDVLDFSKIEAGMMYLEKIKVDLFELLENTIDIVKYQADKKQIELLLNIDNQMPRYANIDPIRLKQVLANLLSNAVKFTEFGEVELKVSYHYISDQEGKIKFEVRDTGIGISKIQQEKLFKAFSQGDSSTTRKYGGTGLGLVISDLIVRKMGGEIKLKSQLNVGSEFSFEINTEIEFGEKLNIASLSNLKKCLIIDDNANNRLILKTILQQWQINCECCENGLKAIETIEKNPTFNLIICDYNMPQLNGIETIEKIQALKQWKINKEPIILLHTSTENENIQKKCEDLGIHYRLTKPVKKSDLFLYLSKVINDDEIRIIKQNKNQSLSYIENTKNYTILIAEDVETNMMVLTELIKRKLPNAKILEAQNGEEAIQIYKSHKIDLIFMDVQMPHLDGIQSTKIIRNIEQETNFKIPIIAQTAGAFKEERLKCIDAGMDDFIIKPIDTNRINEILDKYLKP